MKRRVTMAFWVLIHVLILPIPKEKSLPFHRLKLTVISKNFRYTSYNFCICDSTTGAAYSFCFASFQAFNLNVPTVRSMRRLGTSTRNKSRAKFLCFSVWLMVIQPRWQFSRWEKMSSNLAKQASLILDDGTIYKGKLFGAAECVAGEVGKSKLLLICNIWRVDFSTSRLFESKLLTYFQQTSSEVILF